jgi:hypothetical protein
MIPEEDAGFEVREVDAANGIGYMIMRGEPWLT